MPRIRAVRWPLAAVALVVAAVAGPAEAQRVEGSFQRTLTVADTPEIDVTTGSGRIDVRPGTEGRVEIEARIQSHHRSIGGLTAEERVRRIEASPPIQQAGRVIRIGRFNDEELARGVSISYTLRVPPSSSVKARSGSGSQHIEGVKGTVEAQTGSGGLTLGSIGGAARASTGSGSITAEVIGGGLHATTGSGSIQATSVSGPVTVRTGSGRIDVAQAAEGDIEATAGSGSIRLRGVRGAVRASTASGGLAIDGRMSGQWSLSAASGTVEVSLLPGQGFELDANTGSGRIDVGLPVTITGPVSRRSLRGSVQGGGPLLHVRTASGSIRIRSAEGA